MQNNKWASKDMKYSPTKESKPAVAALCLPRTLAHCRLDSLSLSFAHLCDRFITREKNIIKCHRTIIMIRMCHAPKKHHLKYIKTAPISLVTSSFDLSSCTTKALMTYNNSSYLLNACWATLSHQQWHGRPRAGPWLPRVWHLPPHGAVAPSMDHQGATLVPLALSPGTSACFASKANLLPSRTVYIQTEQVSKWVCLHNTI